ncbi:kinase-like domain, phloem protein 2-like protein [Tanacetum coccineum]
MCRFSEVAKIESARELNIEIDIETIFLSPGITYAAYLVFILDGSELENFEIEETGVSGQSRLVGLTYKLKEVSERSITYLADVTNDGWMIIELCQFICYKKVTKLEVFLESTFENNGIVLEGIQFLPIEKPANDESVQVEKANILDTEREQKLPDDYRDIIKMAKDRVPHNITNKDLYLLLSNGILTNKGQAFFYLDKDGIKCCMLSASSVLKASEILESFHWISNSESRFGKVAECLSGDSFGINCHINSHMLSPNTAYAIYLVYVLPKNSHENYTCPLQVQDFDEYHSYNSSSTEFFFACLVAPKTHVINTIEDDGDHNQIPELKPLYRPKIDGIPKERKDGWMEVQMWNYKPDEVMTTKRARFVLSLCDSDLELTGLIVLGIEIRPLEIEVLPADMEAQAKAELNKKAHSVVILCLGNKVLREVTRKTTAAEVKFEDEDLALLLLTSLPASYEYFVDTLPYGREALTLKDVMTTLNSNEIKERCKVKGDDGKGLYVRGRTDRRDSRQSRGKSRSKSRGERPIFANLRIT